MTRKRSIYKRALMLGLVAASLTTFTGCSSSSNNSSSQTTSKKAKAGSLNIPGQKINKSKAKDEDLYWTDKSDDRIRYFTDDSKKITAVKVTFAPDYANTSAVDAYLETVLHDKNYKVSNSKKDNDSIVLKTGTTYNIYSPKWKKWFWIRIDKNNNYEKDAVRDFAVYPGKSDEAL